MDFTKRICTPETEYMHLNLDPSPMKEVVQALHLHRLDQGDAKTWASKIGIRVMRPTVPLLRHSGLGHLPGALVRMD